MKRLNPFTLILTAFVCAPVFSNSAEIILQEGVDNYAGTQDTSIYRDQSNNSNGGGEYLYVGATGSSARRALIRFDLTSIPSNATVTSVQLIFTVNQSGPVASNNDPHSLFRITSDWGEGNVVAPDPGGNGGPAQTGNATWMSSSHPQTLWQTPGGDFADLPSIQDIVSRTKDETVTFQSAELQVDVQVFVANPAENFGWILMGDEAGNRNARRFYSSEGEATKRPKLVVEYTAQVKVNNWELY